MRAQVTERTLFPKSMMAVAAVAAPVVFNRTLNLPIAAPTGGGERFDVSWRFQEHRPRVALKFAAPAPWGGVWGVGGSWERQPFELPVFPTAERSTACASWDDWVMPYLQIVVRGGADRWKSRESALGTAGVGVQFLTAGERFRAQVERTHGSATILSVVARAVIRLTSSTAKRGWVALGEAGAGMMGDAASPGHLVRR